MTALNTTGDNKRAMSNTRYFEILVYRTLAGLRTEALQSYLSFLWWIVEPLIYMAIFYVVFGLLFNRGGEDYVPYLLCGLTAWKWFGSCVDAGANAIKANGALMGQVHIPKIIFPGITILQNTVKFLFVLAILMIFIQVYRPGLHLSYLALPVVLGVQFLLICALAFLLASAVPFIPDITYVIRNGLQALFFLSGVFFTVSDFPEQYQRIFYMNPMVTIIESYREVLVLGEWPNFYRLFWIGLVSAIGIVVAFYIIKRLDREYPKVI